MLLDKLLRQIEWLGIGGTDWAAYFVGWLVSLTLYWERS